MAFCDFFRRPFVNMYSRGPQKNVDQKKQVIGGPSIALEALKLEGPRGRNPTSLYGQSAPEHKQHLVTYVSEVMLLHQKQMGF
jgi:hypothetical protein